MARLLGISWKKRIWVTTAMMMAVDLSCVTCHVSRYVTSRDNRPVHQRHGPRLLQLEGEDAEADLAEAHHTCRGNSEGRAQ